jgi:hypothetical protein
MESQRNAINGKQKTSPPAAPVQQDFLFVDASKSAKSSRQGRRNARSFVMQKARRERPWSTSKHASKQRKSPETTSPGTVGTPDLSTTPITATPSPPIVATGAEYFPFTASHGFPVVKQEICSDCQIFLCRPGQTLCPRCLWLQPSAPAEEVDNRLFDPFGTVSVEMNSKVSELLDHCKCLVPALPERIPLRLYRACGTKGPWPQFVVVGCRRTLHEKTSKNASRESRCFQKFFPVRPRLTE